jgi:probable rRNA maturation factor
VVAVEIQVENRSGVPVDEDAAISVCRRVLSGEGVDQAELGLAFVGPAEMRQLKCDHLGVDDVTDVLAFPIDGLDDLPGDVPRQLGDVLLCPQVVKTAWRGPLVHGILHLLGYEHGEDMERREERHAR